MENERTFKLVVRWSFLSAVLIALFWTVWYVVNGDVPVVTHIKITDEYNYLLPFRISRWWDILIGPIFSILVILLVTSKQIHDEEIAFGLIFRLASGLVHGLIFRLASGLILLAFGIVFVLAFGLASGLILFAFGLVFVLVF